VVTLFVLHIADAGAFFFSLCFLSGDTVRFIAVAILLPGYLSLLDFPGHLGAKRLDLPQIWHVFPKVGQVWTARCCERPQGSSGTYWACNGATGCSWQNATQLQRE
jgi:hypothetical protein